MPSRLMNEPHTTYLCLPSVGSSSSLQQEEENSGLQPWAGGCAWHSRRTSAGAVLTGGQTARTQPFLLSYLKRLMEKVVARRREQHASGS